MAELDDDAALCAALGAAAAVAAERYTAAAVVPQIESVYEAVIRERTVAR